MKSDFINIDFEFIKVIFNIIIVNIFFVKLRSITIFHFLFKD